MSKDCSFDVVSEFDRQELVNALDQAKREITTRFDLKDSNTDIELADKSITITTASEMALQNVLQILGEKIAKRGLSPLLLDTETKAIETALGGRVRQEIPLRNGIDKEQAKKVVNLIKESKLKVQASIQGEQVRVSGKNRDDLQSIIKLLREQEAKLGLPLQYQNFR